MRKSAGKLRYVTGIRLPHHHMCNADIGHYIPTPFEAMSCFSVV